MATGYIHAQRIKKLKLQGKTATSNGLVTPDEGYDGLASVDVKVSGGGGGVNYVKVSRGDSYGYTDVPTTYDMSVFGQPDYTVEYEDDIDISSIKLEAWQFNTPDCYCYIPSDGHKESTAKGISLIRMTAPSSCVIYVSARTVDELRAAIEVIIPQYSGQEAYALAMFVIGVFATPCRPVVFAEDGAIDERLYNFLTSQYTEQAKKELYEIPEGTVVIFNDKITFDEGLSQGFLYETDITSNATDYKFISFDIDTSTVQYGVYNLERIDDGLYLSTIVYENGAWTNKAYKTVTLKKSIYFTDKEHYEWFLSNCTLQGQVIGESLKGITYDGAGQYLLSLSDMENYNNERLAVNQTGSLGSTGVSANLSTDYTLTETEAERDFHYTSTSDATKINLKSRIEYIGDVGTHTFNALAGTDFGFNLDNKAAIVKKADEANYRLFKDGKEVVEKQLQEKDITSNGTYTPDSGYDGFSKVTVNVAGGGGGGIVISDTLYYFPMQTNNMVEPLTDDDVTKFKTFNIAVNNVYVKEAVGQLKLEGSKSTFNLTFSLDDSAETKHIYVYFLFTFGINMSYDLHSQSAISNFKTVINELGGFTTNNKDYADWLAEKFGLTYQVLNSVSTGDGVPVEISTEADMDAFITAENKGKVAKYTGTTGKYTANTLYLIEGE